MAVVAAEEVEPMKERLLDVPSVPQEKLHPVQHGPDKKAVPVATIAPDEAIVVPTKGRTRLKRVFLGLGWRGEGGQRVDLDCCVAPFVKGKRVEEDTVWFGNLHDRPNDGYSTIKHTGDILTGQDRPGEVEDLERIYVDLENLASDVDCVAFEGNVFSVGDGSSGAERTFASLESAYIRLVNAGLE